MHRSEENNKRLKVQLASKAKAEQQLIKELEQVRSELTQIAPSETAQGLRGQVSRAQQAKAEYSNTLLKILNTEGVSLTAPP